MKSRAKLQPLPREGGFTLIELMVGTVIALMTILLVIQVFSVTDIRKREIAGGSDAQQIASLTMNHLVSAIKQAGSSMSHSKTVLWGCALNVKKDGKTLIPSTLPKPFDTLPTNLRVAPALIRAGDTDEESRESDVLMVMSGGSESASIAFSTLTSPGDATVYVQNTNGFVKGDLLLVTTDSGDSCKVLQVAPSFTLNYQSGFLADTPKQLPLGGNYTLLGEASDLSNSSKIFNLGLNPQFQVFGARTDDQSLVVYDLLQLTGLTTPTPIGENIFLFRALYGVDDGSNGGTPGDGIVDRWIPPTSTGWIFSDLQADTADARVKIAQIKAIRIALVVRSSYRSNERFQDDLELFGTVEPETLKQTVTLTDDERLYRYQVYETIIPILNMRS